jgi:membrane-associated phospholipid phosphatase
MVVPTETPERLEASHRAGGPAEAEAELFVGGLLLGAATLAGLLFVRRPWPNRLDAIGFRLLPPDLTSKWAGDTAQLGSLPVLVAGVAVLCVVAVMSRKWVRAVSCAVAPMAAVLIVQTVAKPLVGRHLEGALSYPSGTVTAVAALAAAAFLVVPWFARPFAAVAGGVAVAAVCAAVVVLRWHFPTDALGGACVGAGAVFAVDGVLLSIRDRHLIRRASAVLGGRSAAKGAGTPKDVADVSKAMADDLAETPRRDGVRI